MIATGRSQRYKHPSFRGTWWIKSATKKYVTLKSDIPYFRTRKIPTDDFPHDLDKEWEKI